MHDLFRSFFLVTVDSQHIHATILYMDATETNSKESNMSKSSKRCPDGRIHEVRKVTAEDAKIFPWLKEGEEMVMEFDHEDRR